MSKDPCYTSARHRIEEMTGRDFGKVFPLANDTEYELKLGWRPKRNKRTPENSAPNAFLRLVTEFNKASQFGFSKFDPNGLIPQDYILTSFSFDTVDISTTPATPTAQFLKNDTQFRLRGALEPTPNEVKQNPFSFYNKLGANLKEALRTKKDGEHRFELECYIADPKTALEQFREHFTDLPEFMQEIDSQSLRLNAICMTARTGFFFVCQIPETEAYVTIHGVFDCSNFTTPSMEHFTQKSPRWEIELEVKEFMGPDHLGLDGPEVQQDMVNRLFPHFTKIARDIGFFVYKESKLEDATASVERFYRGRIPNAPKKNGIPPGMNYALTHGPSLQKLFDSITTYDHSLFTLVGAMPKANDMVSNEKFLRCLGLAA